MRGGGGDRQLWPCNRAGENGSLPGAGASQGWGSGMAAEARYPTPSQLPINHTAQLSALTPLHSEYRAGQMPQDPRSGSPEVLVSDQMSVGFGHEQPVTPHQSTVEHVH